MAIGQPFNQQFRAGDVIYGISQSRAPYINSLPPNVVNHLRAQGHYVICDEYNNRTFGKTPGAQEFGLNDPDSRHEIRTNLQHHSNAPYLSDLQKASLETYYEALKGTHYAPKRAVRLNQQQLTAKGNTGPADLAFRRACKFGLEYIIEHQQRTVHFVLDVPPQWNVPGDRIQSIDVVTKGQFAGHVPITTSELRKCYRRRAAWTPTGRLKFYFALVQVEAPWVTDEATWDIYRAHRINKGVA